MENIFLVNQIHKKWIYWGFYYCLLFKINEKFDIINISEEFSLENKFNYDEKKKSIKIWFWNWTWFEILSLKLKTIYWEKIKVINVSNKFI